MLNPLNSNYSTEKHHARRFRNHLTVIQYEYINVIILTTYVNFDNYSCLEILPVKEKIENLEKFTERSE